MSLDLFNAIVAVLAIGVAIFVFLKNRVIRKIGIDVLHTTPVIQVNSEVPNLKILYQDEEITDLYVSEIEITNSGNRDIVNLNQHPLVIDTGSGIFSVTRVSKRKDFFYSIDGDQSSGNAREVQLQCGLLKRNEKFKIKLITRSEPTFDFSGSRIPDVSIVTVKKRNNKFIYWISQVVAVVSLVIALAYLDPFNWFTTNIDDYGVDATCFNGTSESNSLLIRNISMEIPDQISVRGPNGFYKLVSPLQPSEETVIEVFESGDYLIVLRFRNGLITTRRVTCL